MIRLKKKINNNKVAIVTGAGSGIGEAVALALLKEGWHVFLVGRNTDKLIKTKKKSEKNKNKGFCQIFSCDVSVETEVQKLFLEVDKKYKRLDVLFNNAGIGLKTKTIDEINFQDWKKVIDVNINGMFLCAKFAYKLMKKQKPRGGRIINNGSISAYTPRPGSVAYTTSKHAVTGLTKSIALDGRNYDIVCSQIDIGNAETKLTRSFKEGVIQPNGKKLKEATMDVKHVAETIINILKL